MEWEGYSLQTEEVKQRLVEGEYKGNILETLVLIQPHFPPFQRSMHCCFCPGMLLFFPLKSSAFLLLESYLTGLFVFFAIISQIVEGCPILNLKGQKHSNSS